jgi:hypothetical protein
MISKTAGGSNVLEPTNKVVFFFNVALRVTVKESWELGVQSSELGEKIVLSTRD